MGMQLLVSAMNQQPQELAKQMNISSDAIIINQCDKMAYEEFFQKGYFIRAFSFAERGVGLSRNNALLRASGEIILFSDEDIVYNDNYKELVEKEFEKHKNADVILFNFDVCEERRTYYNESFKKVSWYNCGRYPTFSFAMKTEKVQQKNITYSLLFGGGAKYSNGEDSLFLKECIDKGLKVFATEVNLGQEQGKEQGRESTWFKGYNEKFFFDRGVLYKYLYGSFSYILALRFLKKHRHKMCQEISTKEAWKFLRRGIQSVSS